MVIACVGGVEGVGGVETFAIGMNVALKENRFSQMMIDD